MKHVWVAIQYAVIDVKENPETGNIDWEISEAADQLAKEDSAAGCWICEVDLNHDTINTECAGEPDSSTPQN